MMSTSDAPTRGPARPLPYVVAGILLAVAIVAPLLVPLYARTDPRLYGMPFFYWYQILSVFIEALILWAVYLIVTREDNRRRAAVRDLSGPAADDAAEVIS
ncbi:DUF3311 domain-containing protein [Lacisediminihabitans sp.]|uniref:DUF3311 domain-containing protein n=1 Tax=Lacisediminihabitans sp. TaxID=2787631 RepID=UPI00374CC184